LWPIGADFTGSAITAHAVFLTFRHFAQRAFCTARIRAIAAPDSLRRFLDTIETTFWPLALADRAP
jgi:hypothetical protein